MTKDQIQKVRDALQNNIRYSHYGTFENEQCLTILDAELARDEKPVARIEEYEAGPYFALRVKLLETGYGLPVGTPLYLHPPVAAPALGMAHVDHLCQLMMKHGLSTGHGDTLAQVIDELDLGLAELRAALAKQAAPDSVPLAEYQKLQALVTSQGIRLMEQEEWQKK